MESIREYVDIVFDQYERTQELEELHEEIIQNASEHLEDCLAAGLSRREAEAAVREGMGDLNAMLKEIGAVKKTPRRGDGFLPGTENLLQQVIGRVFHEEEPVSFRWEEIRRIVVSGTYMDVRAEGGSGTVLTAELRGREDDCIFTVRDGVLFAEQNRKAGGRVSLRLMLPEQVTELQCRLKSGDVEMSGVVLENCSLRTVSGDVDAEDVRIRTFSAETSSGDVGLEDADLGSVDIRTVSGDADVEAEGLETIRIHTVSGDADLELPVFAEAEIVTTSGDVSCALHGAEDTEIRLDTVSGDVSCRYDMHGGSRRLAVRTVSGDIDIV